MENSEKMFAHLCVCVVFSCAMITARKSVCTRVGEGKREWKRESKTDSADKRNQFTVDDARAEQRRIEKQMCLGFYF